jgi:hypothetical protein
MLSVKNRRTADALERPLHQDRGGAKEDFTEVHMKLDDTDNSRLLSLVPLILSWSAALLIAASIVGLWFLLAARWPWAFFLLATLLTLVAVAGLLRQHARTRSTRRLLAALEVYTQREIAQARRLGSRRAQGPLTSPRSSGQFPLPSA